MRKRHFHRLLFAAAVIAVYFIGLSVGVMSVCGHALERQYGEFYQILETIIHDFSADSALSVDISSHDDSYVLIYDENRTLLLRADIGKERVEDKLYKSCENYLSAVYRGKTVNKIAFTYGKDDRLFDIMFITGIPYSIDGASVGAAFAVRDQAYLASSLLGFFCCFSAFFALAVFTLLLYNRRKQKLERIKQTYIDNVTHALKTPTASIKALVETLCDGMEPDIEKQGFIYGLLLQQVNLQSHMIHDILELSQIQNHGMDFRKSSVCPRDVFGGIEKKYTEICEFSDISFHISPSIYALPELHTNPKRIIQVLEIVLDNAVKFVGEEGEINIDAVTSQKRAIISVHDSGIGIEKSVMPHIFERFYLHNSNNNIYGNGLGLAIAYELMAGLKERIWAESKPGQGTTFFITIGLKQRPRSGPANALE